MAETLTVDGFGVYAESTPDSIAVVDGFGVYAESDNTPTVYVTGFGVYAELLVPFPTYPKVAAGNVSAVFDGVTLSAQSASMTSTVNEIEYTSFASGGVLKIAGLPMWTVTLGGGTWTHSTDGALGKHGTQAALTVTVDNVSYAWDDAFVSDYGIELEPKSAIGYTATFSCNGNPTRA